MNYKEQLQKWLKDNPKATLEDAWLAGYWQCTDNWCGKEK